MKIRFLRMECGLTQYELAEVTGLSRAVIQLIEIGARRPKEEEILAIAHALGVSAIDLIGKGEIYDL